MAVILRRFRGIFGFVVIFTLLTLIFGLPGCGGGGGGSSSGPALSGKKAAEATLISGDQALNGGMGYPFQLLRAAAPTGSNIPRLFGIALRPGSLKTPTTSSLTYDAALNLYAANPLISGNSLVVDFYSDSAGTEKAGNLTLTEPGSTFSTSYSTYPVTLTGSIDILKGNLVCSGSISITFSSSSGANTIQGSFNLPANGIQTTFNMNLDPSGDVGGTATVIQNGITMKVSNISGSLADTLTGNVTVSPEGWTGTGKFSLLTGAYDVTLTVGPDETDSGLIQSNGDMLVSYSDGTETLITNPITSSLTTGGGTSGGTTGSTTSGTTGSTTSGTTGSTTSGTTGSTTSGTTGSTTSGTTGSTTSGTTGSTTSGTTGSTTSGTTGSTTSGTTGSTTSGTTGTTGSTVEFTEPVQIGASSGMTLAGVSSAKTMVGYTYTNFVGVPYYLSSPTAAPVAMNAGSGNAVTQAVNAKGVVIGYSPASQAGLYWASPTSSPAALPIPASGISYAQAFSINDNGEIVGNFFNSNGSISACYWKKPGTMPVVLPGNPSIAYGAIYIDNKSQICCAGKTTGFFVWSSPTAQPTSVSGTLAGFSEYGAVGSTSSSFAIWTSPAWAEVNIGGTMAYNSSVGAINDLGEVGGSLGAEAAIWASPSATPELLSSAIPTQLSNPYALQRIFAVFDDGSIVIAGQDSGANPLYYYASPKTSPKAGRSSKR